MAKTTAPALSFGAGGSIAKTMVFSRWRGVKYVRQHVIPANPQTVAQQLTRTTFAFLREVFKFAGPGQSAAWNAFASGRPFTGMNKFVGENLRVLRGQADCSLMIFSPGAKGGLPPASIAVTSPVPGEAHVAAVIPTLPSGWSMNSIVAVAIHQQDPSLIFDSDTGEAINTVTPWDTVNITALASGETYEVGVWLVQNKPDGSLAYSVSVSAPILIT